MVRQPLRKEENVGRPKHGTHQLGVVKQFWQSGQLYGAVQLISFECGFELLLKGGSCTGQILI